MANQGGNSTHTIMRDYRKGNWTPSETMILIEAKKNDDERRTKRTGGDSTSEGIRNKSVEPRWKWVEDFCWKRGCLRSQNQCNDKWDNLMRDYKKIERNERKERNLPTNMSPQIYEALVGVVERKPGVPNIGFVTVGSNIGQLSLPPPPTLALPAPPAAAPPPPPPLPSQAVQTLLAHQTYSQPMPTVDSDTSEHSDSPAKRRRKGGESHGEGTSGTANASSNSHEVGTAISKSASIIAEALQASEEREERRHRELLSLHERRLKMEESKTEISKQGIDGLVDAINKLADSIHALASHKNQSAPK
uniref:Myb-like domain-containing protein n=1 Tax=Fagus sylvatica TaxID=28930 RepID=A0A2N9II00_FAGSY